MPGSGYGYGRSGSSSATGQSRLVNTYGSKTGAVRLQTAVSRQVWSDKVAGGAAAAAAVNIGQKVSPTLVTHSQAYLNNEAQPPTSSSYASELPKPRSRVVDLVDQESLAKPGQIRRPPRAAKKASVIIIDTDSEVDSSVEIVSKPQPSSQTNARAVNPFKRPVPSKTPRIRKQRPDGSSSPAAFAHPTARPKLPFPSSDLSSPLKPLRAADHQIGSTSPVPTMGPSNQNMRSYPLGRKDSNNTSPSKAKEASSMAVKGQVSSKGKGPAARNTLAPVANLQALSSPLSRPRLPASHFERSPIPLHPGFTSTPRVSQAIAPGVRRASSQASSSSANAVARTHQPQLVPPRGHAKVSDAPGRKPSSSTIAAPRGPNAKPAKQDDQAALHSILAHIKGKEPAASPLKPRLAQQATLPSSDNKTTVRELGPLSELQKLKQQEVKRDSRPRISSPRPGSSSRQSELVQRVQVPPADELTRLVSLCRGTVDDSQLQGNIPTFMDFVEHCPLVPGGVAHWKKLGEASYSEVFLVSAKPFKSKYAKNLEDAIVCKVIALHGSQIVCKDGQEIPATSTASDVSREIQITKALMKLEGDGDREAPIGYPDMKGCYIVKGKYPASLLECWDAWKRGHRAQSLNARPDVFPEEQHYAIICLAHGGSDLETVKLNSWTEAATVLWQVAHNLSRAERELQFEHRDLHWGNILVAPMPIEEWIKPLDLLDGNGLPATLATSIPNCFAQAQKTIKTTIIDFTLSRATLPGVGVVSGGLEDDEIFEGSGDHQFDCYRTMKLITGATWSKHRPSTNIVWLHYLARKLLQEKKPKTANGQSGSSAASKSHRTGTRKTRSSAEPKHDSIAEKHCYEALVGAEVMLDSAVQAAVSAAEARKAKPADGPDDLRRRSRHSSADSAGDSDLLFRNAGDFVEWWISA